MLLTSRSGDGEFSPIALWKPMIQSQQAAELNAVSVFRCPSIICTAYRAPPATLVRRKTGFRPPSPTLFATSQAKKHAIPGKIHPEFD